MPKTTALYLHGLGRTELRPPERFLLERNKRKGLDYVAADIDWRSSETFHELLGRVAGQASDILDGLGDDDRLILEGSSAGGSLAINVFKKLDDPRVRAISHSGRLSVGTYAEQSWRSLSHCAHLGTGQASQSFFDSVAYCDITTAPSLTADDKSKLLITMPLADQVVPTGTMTIESVRTIRVPVVGHSPGIGLGIARTPSLAETL